jgi:hypothetical protein
MTGIGAQTKTLMEDMGSLGYPKELLLARGIERTKIVIKRWKNMQFVDVPLRDDVRDRKDIAKPAGLVDFVQRKLHEDQTSQGTEWLSFHVPEVRCAYATAKGGLGYCQAGEAARFQGPAVRLAKEWLEAEQKSGPPTYDMNGTAKALERVAIHWPEI